MDWIIRVSDVMSLSHVPDHTFDAAHGSFAGVSILFVAAIVICNCEDKYGKKN